MSFINNLHMDVSIRQKPNTKIWMECTYRATESYHTLPLYRFQWCRVQVNHLIWCEKDIKLDPILLAFTHNLTRFLFLDLLVIFGEVKFIFPYDSTGLGRANIHYLDQVNFHSESHLIDEWWYTVWTFNALTTFIWGAHVANSRSQFRNVESGATTRCG